MHLEPGQTPSHYAAPDEEVVQAIVRQRFIDLFLSQNERAQLGLLVAASLVASIWYSRASSLASAAWFLSIAALSVARYFKTEAFVRHGSIGTPTGRIATVLLANGIAMAIPLLAFESFSDLERAAISIILIAAATASVATTSGYQSIFLAFASPMLVSLSLAWVVGTPNQGGRGTAYGIGALIFLFLLFLVSIARQAHQVFEESGRFRHGEQRLTLELKEALDAAEEANRAKTHFLAAASHDLRQPIHSMNVLIAALTLREVDPRSRKIINLLETVNQSLSKQLDGLLDISKLDAGIIKPDFASFRLEDLLAPHHVALVSLAQARGLRVELNIEQDLHVLSDAALLARAISNLTDNALKFTRPGGTIRLAAQRAGARVALSVEDDGIGIAQEEQELVFRAFYQVSNVERDRSKGLGLGLSIVQRLCGLLGVELQLVSRPQAGTRVTLHVPAAQAAPAVPSAPVPARLSGMSVLVVDDEAFVRTSMYLLLAELGCTVHLADGLAQAEAAAQGHRIDAVISDLRLREGASGIEVIRRVCALHPHARATLLTGDTAPDRIREAHGEGVALRHKPVGMGELLAFLGTTTGPMDPGEEWHDDRLGGEGARKDSMAE